MEDRNWRDAKIPQWVKDSITEEIKAWEITAALSWPTENKPEPLPFHWGDYDRLYGEMREGIFWMISHGGAAVQVEIRKRANVQPDEISQRASEWRPVLFKAGRDKFHSDIPRGEIFSSEYDAKLTAVWQECEASAQRLLKLRRALLA